MTVQEQYQNWLEEGQKVANAAQAEIRKLLQGHLPYDPASEGTLEHAWMVGENLFIFGAFSDAIDCAFTIPIESLDADHSIRVLEQLLTELPAT